MNRTTRWLSAGHVHGNRLPAQLRAWLLDSGSLTSRLARCCKGKFRLRLIRQTWQRPLPEESWMLGLRRGSFALVREIYLQCDDVPWVYGRSVIPAHTSTGTERRLARWGQRSLGHYLFSGRDIHRGDMEIAQLAPRDTLYQLACQDHPLKVPYLWGRRSIFYIKDKPLLVEEIFLTDPADV